MKKQILLLCRTASHYQPPLTIDTIAAHVGAESALINDIVFDFMMNGDLAPNWNATGQQHSSHAPDPNGLGAYAGFLTTIVHPPDVKDTSNQQAGSHEQHYDYPNAPSMKNREQQQAVVQQHYQQDAPFQQSQDQPQFLFTQHYGPGYHFLGQEQEQNLLEQKPNAQQHAFEQKPRLLQYAFEQKHEPQQDPFEQAFAAQIPPLQHHNYLAPEYGPTPSMYNFTSEFPHPTLLMGLNSMIDPHRNRSPTPVDIPAGPAPALSFSQLEALAPVVAQRGALGQSVLPGPVELRRILRDSVGGPVSEATLHAQVRGLEAAVQGQARKSQGLQDAMEM